MTYIVLDGALNSTHSLTPKAVLQDTYVTSKHILPHAGPAFSLGCSPNMQG